MEDGLFLTSNGVRRTIVDMWGNHKKTRCKTARL